jgi:murein tripeptide amidase MpaA
MHISANFDSGNITVLASSDPGDIRLAIRPDVGGEHMQWFHFRVSGARDQDLVLRITNAAKVSYPHAWKGYSACTSSDRELWTRAPTEYRDGELVIRHRPKGDLQWYAYFAPFSLERHHALLARCQASPLARLDRLGATVDGRDLDRITIGNGVRQIWVIARQHPGESMAEWWMSGFLARLLDPGDPLARQLRTSATLHVVPNMNPDGSARGHLRCNAAGANLNRVWHGPTEEQSPEVLHVLTAMGDTGVDLCLDVHGDEALPFNFISGCEGVPGFDSRIEKLSQDFEDAYEAANPDFQQVHGYPRTPAGKANLTMCSNAIADRFGCPGLTLEMPFKDNNNAPDPIHGWSPHRAGLLGRDAVVPMVAVVGRLR